MAGPLVVCSSCSTHVLVADAKCPHCGAALRTSSALGRTAGAVLMGLTLAGCPSDDDGQESMGGSDASTMSPATESGNMGSSSTDPSGTTNASMSDSDSTTDESTSGSTFGAVQSAYGSPDTETFGTTDITDSDTSTTGTGTDTEGTGTDGVDTEGDSTSASPLYGSAASD
ncbi:MAG: hypothetical protein ACE37F_20960 [Nannocystaceae bacterium]|nr:hypothetical protein [bacterium]